jgi:hypothetical protein
MQSRSLEIAVRCSICSIALFCASLLPSLVAADYELYKNDETRLVLKGTFMGAFFQNGSWFGQSEEFLGGDTDSWGEFGAELGLAWEYTSGKSSVFAELRQRGRLRTDYRPR